MELITQFNLHRITSWRQKRSMNYGILIIFIILTTVQGHSNLRDPVPRGNIKWSSYCSKGLGCSGPCEAPTSESHFTRPFYPKKFIRRGERIKVEWLRQNHPGGFVRLAFASFNQSDTASSFDNNISKYVCYETNCGETEHDPVLGHLNGKGDGLCTTYVTVPNNLPDGPVTMQWIWFGGGVYFSDQETTFANYHNCADMELVGGHFRNEPVTPVFQGGDVATPQSNQCRYWGSNRVGECAQGSETGDSCGRSKQKFGAPYDPNL